MEEKHNHAHEHEHAHGESCSCGHQHDDGCGCGHDHAHGEEINKKAFAAKMAVGIALFIAGYLVNELTELPFYVPLIIFAASYLVVGFNILKEAVEGVLHGNIFNENFLMAIASIGAFIIGEYSEGCAVVILYTIGEFLQDLAVGKSRRSITDMIKSVPQKVHVERGGKLVDEDPENIKKGEVFVVNPGEKIELDGVIESGSAEVDMAALTGESIPASLTAGDEILSGSINVDGMLKVRATKEYKDSTVSRILEMIEDADSKKSHAEKFISRFAKLYTPI